MRGAGAMADDDLSSMGETPREEPAVMTDDDIRNTYVTGGIVSTFQDAATREEVRPGLRCARVGARRIHTARAALLPERSGAARLRAACVSPTCVWRMARVPLLWRTRAAHDSGTHAHRACLRTMPLRDCRRCAHRSDP